MGRGKTTQKIKYPTLVSDIKCTQKQTSYTLILLHTSMCLVTSLHDNTNKRPNHTNTYYNNAYHYIKVSGTPQGSEPHAGE